jgi:hypothetical protein
MWNHRWSGPPGGEVIRVRAHKAPSAFRISNNLRIDTATTPHLQGRHTLQHHVSCRLAIGAAKSLENGAAPRIARRTFASCSSKPTPTSRTTTNGSLRCLRETQSTGINAGQTASGLKVQARLFSQSTSRNALKTIDQIKARNKGGVRSSCRSRPQK